MAQLSIAARNAALAAIGALADGGSIRIYAAPETVLAECSLGAPAFNAPDAGSISSAPIGMDADAAATGTAEFFRIYGPGGLVLEGTVGTASADMILDTVSIEAGAPVAINSVTLALP